MLLSFQNSDEGSSKCVLFSPVKNNTCSPCFQCSCLKKYRTDSNQLPGRVQSNQALLTDVYAHTGYIVEKVFSHKKTGVCKNYLVKMEGLSRCDMGTWRVLDEAGNEFIRRQNYICV